mmetsp:Transcript_117425/g.367096  ORF Transcript_117425/g.367096 Transcript_117425/m.367096 type:complete len:133 (+) Transcript_117425:639-1037(+)
MYLLRFTTQPSSTGPVIGNGAGTFRPKAPSNSREDMPLATGDSVQDAREVYVALRGTAKIPERPKVAAEPPLGKSEAGDKSPKREGQVQGVSLSATREAEDSLLHGGSNSVAASSADATAGATSMELPAAGA